MSDLVAVPPGPVTVATTFTDPFLALPVFSFTGPSRAVPVVRPGEENELFAEDFTIEQVSSGDRSACFLLTRR